MADEQSNLEKGITVTSSALGAAGVALQNYLGTASTVQGFMGATYAASTAGQGIAHSVSSVVGGLSSGAINYLINIGLIQDFISRLKRLRARYVIKKQGSKPGFINRLKDLFTNSELPFWKRALVWIGTGLFIASGLLYGLTAVAVAPNGVLAILGIVAGAMVTPLATIQELEVWLDSFDPLKPYVRNPNFEDEQDDPNSPTYDPIDPVTRLRRSKTIKGKLANVAGHTLAIGTVIALSLGFTLGIATFLCWTGVGIIPALIAGLVLAFTVGAFTEYFFYSPYLTKFCNRFDENWAAFKNSKYLPLGATLVCVNAAVNGVLTYIGITLLFGMLLAAGAAAPPLGAVIAIAVTFALVAAAASFILGTKFWADKFGKKPAAVEGRLAEAISAPVGTTNEVSKTLSQGKKPTAEDSLTAPLLGRGSESSPEHSPRKARPSPGMFPAGTPTKPISIPAKGSNSMTDLFPGNQLVPSPKGVGFYSKSHEERAKGISRSPTPGSPKSNSVSP